MILALVLVSSCSNSGDAKIINLDFWAFGAEGNSVRQFVAGFEAENPGVHVVVQNIPWTAAHEKLLTAYAGNSLPDICQLGNTWIPEFVVLNALEALDNSVDSSNMISSDSYFPGIWETNRIEEKLYGIPWYVDTRVLFYRRDLLDKIGWEKPPQTWEDMLEISRLLVKDGHSKYGIFLPLNEWVVPIFLGMQQGSEILKERASYGTFSGAEFLRGLEIYDRFFQEGLAPKGMTEVNNVYQGFQENTFAMYISGPWNIGEMTLRLPTQMQDDWDTAPLPAIRVEDYPGLSLAGGSSLVVFRSSKHKDLAWDWIEYLSQPDVQSEFYAQTGDLPARVESWTSLELSGKRPTAAFFHQLESVKKTPQVPEWEQIAMKLQQYLEYVVFGQWTSKEAMELLDQDVNKILEKRRWLLSRD
ncbi:MAG: sugar ABC transporter substrate-binding protein [Candidatus Marinimicrobia bacterium]|nr:sugar ABC transporter substrate-binding protein [Candidatus Neomarinimicrobiota bacterium]